MLPLRVVHFTGRIDALERLEKRIRALDKYVTPFLAILNHSGLCLGILGQNLQ